MPDAAISLIQNNLRAIFLMVLSMALFAVEDALIKGAASNLSAGQVLFVLSFGGFIIFAIIARFQNEAIFTPALKDKTVLLRNLGDVTAAMFFVPALTLMQLSNASAILQATPLFVTMGAALFLKEAVGWRRWSAILIGFIGVLIIIRPGLDGFNAASILALIGAICLSVRDIATRQITAPISTLALSASAFLALSVPSFIMMQFQGGWQSVDFNAMIILGFAMFFGPAGYYAVTHSHRIGELGAIAPFRYSRLIFAVLIGIFAFDERLDFWMLLGSALVVASGIYAIYRERIRGSSG